MSLPSGQPWRTEDGRFTKVTRGADNTLYLLWGRLLWSLACPARKICGQKIWNLVYLLSGRVVHIEVTDSLEAASFINALRRFVCRRGPVREIRRDRGTNFIGAETEIKRAIEKMDDRKIKAELVKDNID